MLTGSPSPCMLPAVESLQGLTSPRSPYPTSPGPQASPRPHYPGEERPPYDGPPSFAAGPPLPDRPPFKAYLGNIPYDLDEEVVADFFQGLEVGLHAVSAAWLAAGSSAGAGRACRACPCLASR